MSVSINKVIIGGYVGDDPKVVTFEGGGKIVNCSVATNFSYKNKQGERVETTEWHNLSFRGAVGDIAEKFITKGKYIYVEGRKQTRMYENDQGQTVYMVEIIVQELKLGAKTEGNYKAEPQAKRTVQRTAQPPSKPFSAGSPRPAPTAPSDQMNPFAVKDDDLPF